MGAPPLPPHSGSAQLFGPANLGRTLRRPRPPAQPPTTRNACPSASHRPTHPRGPGRPQEIAPGGAAREASAARPGVLGSGRTRGSQVWAGTQTRRVPQCPPPPEGSEPDVRGHTPHLLLAVLRRLLPRVRPVVVVSVTPVYRVDRGVGSGPRCLPVSGYDRIPLG